jgi:hypothetical protein
MATFQGTLSAVGRAHVDLLSTVTFRGAGDAEGNAHTRMTFGGGDAVGRAYAAITNNVWFGGGFAGWTETRDPTFGIGIGAGAEGVYGLDLEANAHTNLIPSAIYRNNVLDAEGNAHTSLEPTVPPKLNLEANAYTNLIPSAILHDALDAEGNAHTTLIGGELHLGTLDAEGNAFTDMLGDVFKRGTLDAEGNAFTTLDGRVIQKNEGSAEGNAHTYMFADVFRPAVNPPLAGDGVDIADNTAFQFRVNSDLIDLTLVDSCFHVWNMNDLTVSYDGKELIFEEFTGIGSPTYQPEQEVTLDVDFGSGTATRIFSGKIKQRDHRGQNNNESVTYNAVDNFILANDITCLNSDALPRVVFTVGTTVTSVTTALTNVATTFTKNIAEAVQNLFDFNLTQLGSAGIPATIGFPGLEQFNTVLPETVSLENTGFASALSQVAAYQQGVKVIFDEAQQKWIFPNLLTVTTVLCNVASMNITELPYSVDTTDRFTAVLLYADTDDFLDEAIITKSETVNIGGNTGRIIRTEVSLTQKWLSELEDEWTILKAMAGTLGELEDENFFVFKRWSLPDNLIDPWPGTPVRVFQKVNFWGEIAWRPLNGKPNFRRREFISHYHAISRGNPLVEGDAFGPEEVKMAYYPLQFEFTFPTSTTSDGTPTSFVTSTLDLSEFPDSLRVPSSGWDGTAFDDYNVQREFVQIVNRTEVNTLNAQALLDSRKDVVISGNLPVDGDPVEQFVGLGFKVFVQHPTRSTGIESRPALVTEWNYTFGKRGKNSLSLTTDVQGLIRP